MTLGEKYFNDALAPIIGDDVEFGVGAMVWICKCSKWNFLYQLTKYINERKLLLFFVFFLR